ncbi:MAG: CTP synthase [Alphaproteobacteria bacterium]
MNKIKVNIKWLDSEVLENNDPSEYLLNAHAILVPGGFGKRGVEGKIKAINFARTKNIPFFGICFGMQMAVVEMARNLLNLENANSTEFGKTDEPVVDLMYEWAKDTKIEKRVQDNDLGGTMRLGAYNAYLVIGSKVEKIYKKEVISERHRHRFEVNSKYCDQFKKVGVSFSGMSPDNKLPEIVEINDHPWFIGVQYHPELKSRPFDPHPLFVSFVLAALEQSRLV